MNIPKIGAALLVLALLVAIPVSAAGGPLSGKIIALDAGHGGGATGAVGYCNGEQVIEAHVNEAVRVLLAEKINSDGGGSAHLVARISSRSARVADAEAANSDVLISIHHNGSTNKNADYTQSFVTQKNDKEFAKFIHPALVDKLGLPDRGVKNDGYGMTVYGSLPGVLTESYFITNPDGACDYIDYLNGVLGTRVQLEAEAMYAGLVGYFSQTGGGSGGGKGNGKGRNK